MDAPHRCLWNIQDLAAAEIPSEAKSFLQTNGLPEFVGATAIEFGVYDSKDPFVIGQIGDLPVFVNVDGSVWYETTDLQRLFINSSVLLLSEFIDVYLNWPEGIEDEEDEFVVGFIRTTRSRLEILDPPAFGEANLLWFQMWDDIEAMS
jgi:hypothetical protein